MKRLPMIVLGFGILSMLSNCVVRERTYESRSRSTTVVDRDSGGPGGGRSAARDCGPAHHWDGSGCVHNGKAKGHYK